ncbi:TetR/AcrR family transcriptional regulator [Saccharothrix australiensis]|uniref:TetR family transcriptional regulator n=1 Tax=Saccharothrix australiensis TaxID=2072 RepID=A0A495VY74_9PSEU|nr:TetR/AcrR family transcriptional regulator C-terminal domain-containing protein [Saccharothrix australiensis]RKT54276.1 TetR family transcriptional regulator [Saccharothrix australiensis]
MTSATRLPWGSLNREHIIRAALNIARTEGVNALSIRRLAADLGASRMSLYRHIPDKDALLDLVASAIAEHELGIPDPDDGTWDQRLTELAHAMRRQLLAYPGLVELLTTRSNTSTGGLRLAEAILDILYTAGFEQQDAARYYLIFVDITLGRVHRELHGDVVAPKRTSNLLAAASKTPDEFPTIDRTSSALKDIDQDDIFNAELDLLINGIRAATRPAARALE